MNICTINDDKVDRPHSVLLRHFGVLLNTTSISFSNNSETLDSR